jgi:hypothetical protein
LLGEIKIRSSLKIHDQVDFEAMAEAGRSASSPSRKTNLGIVEKRV